MWVRNATLRVDPLPSHTRHRRATAHPILASLPTNETLGVGDGVAGTRGRGTAPAHPATTAPLKRLPHPTDSSLMAPSGASTSNC